MQMITKSVLRYFQTVTDCVHDAKCPNHVTVARATRREKQGQATQEQERRDKMPPRRVSIPVLENDDYLYHLGVTKDKAKASTYSEPLTHSSTCMYCMLCLVTSHAPLVSQLAHPPVGCVDVGDLVAHAACGHRVTATCLIFSSAELYLRRAL
jgi:hypothetical protein